MVIKRRNLKGTQYNGQKKSDKKTKYDRQNNTQNIKF